MYTYASLLISVYTCLALINTGCGMLLPNGDVLFCSRNPRSVEMKTTLTDCKAAIKMIPSGLPRVDFHRHGNTAKPISLELDQDGGRTLRLPASFIAGSCVVAVQAIAPSSSFMTREHGGWFITPREPPRPPMQAATAMYYQVWPNIKVAAETIIQICLHPQAQVSHRDSPKNGGFIITKSVLAGWEFWHAVAVDIVPNQRAALWSRVRASIDKHSIYESKEVPPVLNPRRMQADRNTQDISRHKEARLAEFDLGSDRTIKLVSNVLGNL